jgi:hypothetical protein
MNGKIIDQSKNIGNAANAVAPCGAQREHCRSEGADWLYPTRRLAIWQLLIAFRKATRSPANSSEVQPSPRKHYDSPVETR